jgi:hypothetical protein
MIAWFLFEFVPSSVPNIDLMDVSIVFAIWFCWGLVILFISYLLLICIFKICEIGKLSELFQENCFAIVLILSVGLIFTPPLLLMANVDFFNARYMGEYANGNYKYSRVMKYCITQNKANYRDKYGDLINHDSVRGMMLCFQWERDALIKHEKVEQIKKEVR